MFGWFRKLMDDIGTQPPAFDRGARVRLKVNPSIRGQLRRVPVPVGFGACDWDYEIRREDDGSLITGLRAYEIELDR